MGADIHVIVETKLDDGNYVPIYTMYPENEIAKLRDKQYHLDDKYFDLWYRYSNYLKEDGRNYILFGILAGVRGGDAHTPSFLTIAELKSFNWKQWCADYGKDEDNLEYFFVDYLNRFVSLGLDLEKTRIVFHFDN